LGRPADQGLKLPGQRVHSAGPQLTPIALDSERHLIPLPQRSATLLRVEDDGGNGRGAGVMQPWGHGDRLTPNAVPYPHAPEVRHAQEVSGRELAYDVGIHVDMPAPVFFTGDDGRRYLAYHALITNLLKQDLIFRRIDILDAASGKVVASLDSVALMRPLTLQVSLPDRQRPETMRHLPSGRVALLRAFVPLDSGRAVPGRLRQRITFDPIPGLRIARAQADTDAAPVVTTAAVAMQRAPVVIGPPLRGGPWRAGGAAGLANQHLSFVALDGRARMGDRFAVDFQLVDSAGNILANPFPARLTNSWFYAWRQEVLAVADGRVALVSDGIPENVPTPSGDENMPVPLTRESGAGNQVSIEIAPGVFAQYAHLVPGRIRVTVGERVRKGEVIGLVGNAGHAKNPHLHFQVADAPEINGSEGLPWEMDSFELWGHLRAGGQMPDVGQQPQRHQREMLLQDAIVRFPRAPHSAIDIAIVTDQADPALALIEAHQAGRDPSDAEWGRLLRSEGYRALKAREASIGQVLTDSAFRAFLLSDTLAARADALQAALERYRNLDLRAAAARAMRDRPRGAVLRVRVLAVITPDTSSFASTDSIRRIVLSVDPDQSPEQVEEMLARLLRAR